MYQFMCEVLADPLGLPIQAAWQYAILAVLALIVFAAGKQPMPNRAEELIARGILRIPLFAALWVAAYGLFSAAQWIVLNWVLAIGILAVAVILLFAAWIMLQELLSRV